MAAVGSSLIGPLAGPALFLYDNQIRSFVQANGGRGHSRRKRTRQGQEQTTGGMPEIASLTEMVRVMIQDRERRRDRERDEERRRVEREREESEQRIAEMRREMERLQDMVTERTAVSVRGRTEPIKLTKLTDEDDIESYLTTFERIMAANEVSRERWSFQLAPQLTGKAQQAYAALAQVLRRREGGHSKTVRHNRGNLPSEIPQAPAKRG